MFKRLFSQMVVQHSQMGCPSTAQLPLACCTANYWQQLGILWQMGCCCMHLAGTAATALAAASRVFSLTDLSCAATE